MFGRRGNTLYRHPPKFQQLSRIRSREPNSCCCDRFNVTISSDDETATATAYTTYGGVAYMTPEGVAYTPPATDVT